MKTEEVIEYVRKHFFSRWDKDKQWEIKVVDDDRLHGAHGKSISETKTVLVLKFTDKHEFL